MRMAYFWTARRGLRSAYPMQSRQTLPWQWGRAPNYGDSALNPKASWTRQAAMHDAVRERRLPIECTVTVIRSARTNIIFSVPRELARASLHVEDHNERIDLSVPRPWSVPSSIVCYIVGTESKCTRALSQQTMQTR
jgi:hypothetical protein